MEGVETAKVDGVRVVKDLGDQSKEIFLDFGESLNLEIIGRMYGKDKRLYPGYQLRG